MTMTRRPDRSIVPIRTAMERLIAGDWPWMQFEGGMTELAPPIDVRETDDAYIVEIDLPGIDPQNTEVLIEGRTLTVRGTLTDEREEKQGNYLLKERRQGQFLRAVALPGMVEVDQVSSEFDNGQLTIKLPKATQNRARRIEITPGKRASGSAKSVTATSQQSTTGSDSSTGSQQATASSKR